MTESEQNEEPVGNRTRVGICRSKGELGVLHGESTRIQAQTWSIFTLRRSRSERAWCQIRSMTSLGFGTPVR